MALSITETFGYAVTDQSQAAQEQRAGKMCPFIQRNCWKSFRSGSVVHGTCAVKALNGDEVIVCPDRLYAENFLILRDVVAVAFGPNISVIGPDDIGPTRGQENRVVVFGKRWGKELRVPRNEDNTGGYSADWILARIDAEGKLQEFVPVEVQTMDTTGSYQAEWCQINGATPPEGKTAKGSGINWENVNKRIIPQLLTKGNVFGREPLCQKGLFFVCPTPVYDSLRSRLGSKLSSWPMRSGGLTFRWYSLSDEKVPAQIRRLKFDGQFTTTVENLKEAFNSILNLPTMGTMGNTIQSALDKSVAKKASAGG